MPNSQLEFWAAEPHPVPPIYRQLDPQRRRMLVARLARLILQAVQTKPPLPDPPPQPPKQP